MKRNKKKARISKLLSEKKSDFKTKTHNKRQKRHYVMTKGTIQKDITIINTGT